MNDRPILLDVGAFHAMLAGGWPCLCGTKDEERCPLRAKAQQVHDNLRTTLARAYPQEDR